MSNRMWEDQHLQAMAPQPSTTAGRGMPITVETFERRFDTSGNEYRRKEDLAKGQKEFTVEDPNGNIIYTRMETRSASAATPPNVLEIYTAGKTTDAYETTPNGTIHRVDPVTLKRLPDANVPPPPFDPPTWPAGTGESYLSLVRSDGSKQSILISANGTRTDHNYTPRTSSGGETLTIETTKPDGEITTVVRSTRPDGSYGYFTRTVNPQLIYEEERKADGTLVQSWTPRDVPEEDVRRVVYRQGKDGRSIQEYSSSGTLMRDDTQAGPGGDIVVSRARDANGAMIVIEPRPPQPPAFATELQKAIGAPLATMGMAEPRPDGPTARKVELQRSR